MTWQSMLHRLLMMYDDDIFRWRPRATRICYAVNWQRRRARSGARFEWPTDVHFQRPFSAPFSLGEMNERPLIYDK